MDPYKVAVEPRATTKADEAEVEQALRTIYEASDQTYPNRIVWFDSPLAAAMVHATCALNDSLYVPTTRSIYNARKCKAYAPAAVAAWQHLTENGKLGLGPNLYHLLLGRYNYPRVNGYFDLLRSFGESRTLHSRFSIDLTGQLDKVVNSKAANTFTLVLAGDDLDRVALGAKSKLPTEVVSAANTILALAGPFWAHEHAILACRKHVRFHRDEQGRIHNAEGPSVAWSDGFGLHHLVGVSVKEHLVEQPEKMTIKEIRETWNMEVRRIMIDSFGRERFLKAAGARLAQQDEYGELYVIDPPEQGRFRGGEREVMVKVINSTPEPDGQFKPYYLMVPPTIRTAKEGVAWSFDEDETSYNPLKET